MVEDEVGVRVRVASDGGRLEQLADAAGRVDIVLHRYNDFFLNRKRQCTYMQIYLDFGFFLSCDILPAEGPLCVVEDEVGVRVRALSDGGRLEQLADAAGHVDVGLHSHLSLTRLSLGNLWYNTLTSLGFGQSATAQIAWPFFFLDLTNSISLHHFTFPSAKNERNQSFSRPKARLDKSFLEFSRVFSHFQLCFVAQLPRL